MIPYHVDMLSMFMVNRVYLLPRLVLYHSSLWSQGSALATLANMEISVGVSIRAGFANNPGNYLFFFLMSPFMLLTFVFSNCERLVDPLYTGYHHSGWASFISLTTVGYGTDEAQTHCGRGVSTILIILGITGTSLLISKVQDALHMTPQQQTVHFCADHLSLYGLYAKNDGLCAEFDGLLTGHADDCRKETTN